MTGSDKPGSIPLPTSVSGGPARVRIHSDASAQLVAPPGVFSTPSSSQAPPPPPQHPQTQQFSSFEATPNDDYINGSLLDVNDHFVVYAVLNGLIRVLHRHFSTNRVLLRGHAGQRVTDIRFFQDGDVLATAGQRTDGQSNDDDDDDDENGGGSVGKTTTTPLSTIVVWRIFERSQSEIMSEKLLEIAASRLSMGRICWHPFNPNQFLMIHGDDPMLPRHHRGRRRPRQVATLVETTRITTAKHESEQHAVCVFHDDRFIMDGAVQLRADDDEDDGGLDDDDEDDEIGRGDLLDLCWNGRDTRHVLTVHDRGEIILWDLKSLSPSEIDDSSMWPERLVTLREESGKPVTRCLFLPHEESEKKTNGAGGGVAGTPLTTCFLTAQDSNSTITLWSPFVNAGSTGGSAPSFPSKLQIFGIESPTAIRPSPSFIVDVFHGPAPVDGSPPSAFVLMADRTAGRLFAFHCKSKWESSSDDSDAGVGNTMASRALLVGCDYLVPFQTKYSTYSWSIMGTLASDGVGVDDDENNGSGRNAVGPIFDMKLFCYQSNYVQALTLTSSMCRPPATAMGDGAPSTSGVVVESLVAHEKASPTVAAEGQHEHDDNAAGHIILSSALPTHVSDIGTDDDVEYDEEYDVDDDDDEEEEDDGDQEDGDERGDSGGGFYGVPPDASALPPPVGLTDLVGGGPAVSGSTTTTTINSSPFDNWLGTIASKSNASSTSPPIESTALPPLPPTTATARSPDLPLAGQILPPPPPDDPAIVAIPLQPPRPSEGQVLGAVTEPTSFLSPLDFLPKDPNSDVVSSSNKGIGGSSNNKSEIVQVAPPVVDHAKKKERKKSPKPKSRGPGGVANHGKVTILRRDGGSRTPATSASPTPASSAQTETTPKRRKTPPRPPAANAPPPACQENISTLESGNVAPSSEKNGNSAAFVDEIREAIRNGMESSVVPSYKEAVTESLDEVVVGPIQSSIDKLSKQGVHVDNEKIVSAISESVGVTLRAVFADTTKEVLIPALESAIGQVFGQISERLEKGTLVKESPKTSQDMEAMSSQLSTMTKLITKLTDEVQSLREAVASQQQAVEAAAAAAAASQEEAAAAKAAAAATTTTAAPTLEETRKEILSLLQSRQYEAAFTRAVSASTAEMAVFCCHNADLNDVFGGSSTPLSQPILLCLMQQLGTVLLSSPDVNVVLEVEWLQEIALSLTPTDPSIQRHVPGVLQQLVKCINQRMERGDQYLRRPLQKLLQIVRGMQM